MKKHLSILALICLTLTIVGCYSMRHTIKREIETRIDYEFWGVPTLNKVHYDVEASLGKPIIKRKPPILF